MIKSVLVIAQVGVMMLVCACAQESKMIWVRADGKRGATDPVLVRQFETDRRACAEGGADHVSETCMTQRGYVFVREDQAEAKRVELAEAEKIRREATAQRSR
jgi:hypothetical protein